MEYLGSSWKQLPDHALWIDIKDLLQKCAVVGPGISNKMFNRFLMRIYQGVNLKDLTQEDLGAFSIDL